MIQNSEQDKIINEHFEWMYHLVCNESHYNKISYRKLLYLLHSIPFMPVTHISMDDNRRIDGLDFRYRFGYENGYSTDMIDEYLGNMSCSVLEMMVALAHKVEETQTIDDDYGDRTGQWFWTMIVSLGLGGMDDSNYDEFYAREVIERFQMRDYEPNGKGGLFTLTDPPEDLRKVEIWCQFMWYLNEITKD